MAHIISVDTGGTFTDLVAYDTVSGQYMSTKSLTDYDNVVFGIEDCIRKADLGANRWHGIRFGTTLVINTFMQRSGARTALVTTEGFRDILELGRGNRKLPYDLRYKRHEPLVPRQRRFGVRERVASNGDLLQSVDLADLEALARDIEGHSPAIEALAIVFLNAYLNETNEKIALDFLKRRLPGIYVTSGSEVSREWYEYERTCTAVANAYVGPRMIEYTEHLDQWLRARADKPTYFVMASNGGVYSIPRAQRLPVMLIESGPVGGCIGALAYAEALGLDKVIAFDMGGTTAKCCAIQDGEFEIKTPYYVGGEDHGFPIQGSVLDIVEVGAGGGSIAEVDEQGRLTVGPRSASSTPGPICYRLGGLEPTITDANVVLGRIGDKSMIGGEMTLDVRAAERVIDQRIAAPLGFVGAVDRAAQGILDIGAIIMAGAVKEITIIKGLDPSEFVMLAYGGGGPLHAVELARELDIKHVVIPLHPGAFAAFGMLMADARIDDYISFFGELDAATLERMREQFADTERRMTAALKAEIGTDECAYQWRVDLKYKSQAHTLRVPIGRDASAEAIAETFHAAYRRRYGHASPEKPVVLTGLIVELTARMNQPKLVPLADTSRTMPVPARRSVYFKGVGRVDQTPIYHRDTLPQGAEIKGPAIIEEYGSTTVIGVDDRLLVGEFGELHVYVASSASVATAEVMQ